MWKILLYFFLESATFENFFGKRCHVQILSLDIRLLKISHKNVENILANSIKMNIIQLHLL